MVKTTRRNKKNSNLWSTIITLAILAMFLTPNFSRAMNVDVDIGDFDRYQDETAYLDFIIDIDEGEFISIVYTNITFTEIGTGDSVTCVFDDEGMPLGSCPFMELENFSTDLTETESYGNAFGYGYFGAEDYGYGVGDLNVSGALTGTLTYYFAINSSSFPYLDDVDVDLLVCGGNSHENGEMVCFGDDMEFNVEDSTFDAIMDSLNASEILAGNFGFEGIRTDLEFPTTMIDFDDVNFTWNTNNTAVVAANGSVTRPSSDVYVNVTLNLSQADIGSELFTFGPFLVYADVPVTNITNGTIELAENFSEIVLQNSTGNLSRINIPATVDEVEEIVLNLVQNFNESIGEAIIDEVSDLVVSRINDEGDTIELTIPANTTISGPEEWSGILELPTVVLEDNYTAPVESGFNTDVVSVLNVGFGEARLNLSAPARLVIPGAGDYLAAYSYGEGNLTEITTECDGVDDWSNMANGSECYIESSGDLIIWTWHFTSYAAFSKVEVVDTSSSSDNDRDGYAPSVTPTTTDECTSDWMCTDWSECDNGFKTRDCSDKNKCSSPSYTPVEKQTCEVEEDDTAVVEEEISNEGDSSEVAADVTENQQKIVTDENGSSVWVKIIAIIVLAGIIAAVVMMILKNKAEN